MDWFRLGNLAISSLSTTILFAVMTGYMLTVKNKSADAWFLTGYIASLFILMVSYTVRISLFSPVAIATGQVSNLIVFAVIFLIPFTYYYGGNYQKKESLIVLIISLVLATAVWVSLFFSREFPIVYDFEAQYFTLEFGPRISYITMGGYLWAFITLLRKTVFFSHQEILKVDPSLRQRGGFKALLQPTGRKARSAGSFAILTIITSLIALTYLLFQSGIISRNSYSIVFNTSSMIVCFAIFIVYLNNAPQPTSFLIKLVGIPLAAIMVSIGFIASALLPLINETLSDQYIRKVELVRIALVSSNYNKLPDDAVYVLSASAGPVNFQYMNPSLTSSTLLEKLSNEENILIMEDENIYIPDFFYLNIKDTSSFIIQYPLNNNGVSYWIGFSYASLRLSVHQFWIKFVPVVFGITFFMLFIFPLVLQKGVLTPLSRLLEAVIQVEGGNYHLSLPVTSEDEVGQLAHGYNQMVEALRNAESNFKALAENANDAILILLKDGRIAYANNRALEISGFNRTSLLQKNFRELILPYHLAVVEERFTARIEGGTAPQCYETRIVNKSGRTVPVEITGSGTFWHDSPATVVILRDIEDRKKAEELLRTQTQQLLQADKLASIGALVAGVAHEVNNPNQVISMNARFLSEGLPSIFTLAESDEELDDSLKIAGMIYDEFREASESAVQEISSSTMRINHIVNELKSFVRGETKKEQELIDINHVVRTVADLSRHFIHSATDHFELELGDMIPHIKADSIRLEQVVLNLVQNACQSLADKTKSIIVSTKYNKSAQKVSIEIIDQGKGIPAENLTRVTDPFFTTSRKTGGTGLGLSISNRIIKGLGGTITFKSKVNVGTTVTVSLPVDFFESV